MDYFEQEFEGDEDLESINTWILDNVKMEINDQCEECADELGIKEDAEADVEEEEEG